MQHFLFFLLLSIYNSSLGFQASLPFEETNSGDEVKRMTNFETSLERLILDESKRSEVVALLLSKDKSAVNKLFELSSVLSDDDIDSNDASLILQEYSKFEEGKQFERKLRFTEAKETVPQQYQEIVNDLIAIENDSSLSERHKSQLQINVITHLEPSVQAIFNHFLPIVNETVANSIFTSRQTMGKTSLGAPEIHDAPEHKVFPIPNHLKQHPERRNYPRQLEAATLYDQAPTYTEFIRPVNQPHAYTTSVQPSEDAYRTEERIQNDADLLDSPAHYGTPTVNVFVPRDFEFGGEVSRFSLGEDRNTKTRYVLPSLQTPLRPHGNSNTQFPDHVPISANENGDEIGGSAVVYRPELFPLTSKKDILEERFRIDRDGRYRGIPHNAGPITAGFKEFPGQGRPLIQHPQSTICPDASLQEKFDFESRKAQGSLKNRFENFQQTTTSRPNVLFPTTTVYGIRPYYGPERLTGSLSRPRSYSNERIPYINIDLQNN